MPKIKQTRKYTGRGRKEQIVAQLVEKMDASNGLVFTDYKGLTHQQLENLKKELKKNDSTIVIAKNSLLKLSLGKSKNFADFKDNEDLELPTATLFIKGDMVEPLKQLQKLVKEAGLPKIKFGVLEGQLVDESSVLKIAALPSREVLIAQFVGMLNSPIQGFVSGLNAIPQKFVMTLDAIAKAKPTTPAPAPEPTATPAADETSSETTDASSGTTSTDNAEQSEEATANEASTETSEETSEQTAETVTEEKTEETPAQETPTEEPKEEEAKTDDEGGEK